MSVLDVERVVERFKSLGLLFSAVRFADGSLQLFQWKQMNFFENRSAIEALWASLPDTAHNRQEIARYIAAARTQAVASPSLVPGSLHSRVKALHTLAR
jgi:hypothetical protein